MIDAVVFDLFETLVTESNFPMTRASALGERLGLDRDAFRAEWRLRRPRVMVGQLSFPDALAEISRVLTDRVDRRAIALLREQRVREKAAVFAHISDDIVALLDGLAEHGIAVGVISNCFEEDVLAWTHCPLAPRCRCVLFSFVEKRAKPDPEIYRRAVRELGVRPETTLFVGDGANDELAGARLAGLRSLRAAWFATTAADVPSATRCQDVLRLAAG
jgi:putative hydrolase of the HAD superfamily